MKFAFFFLSQYDFAHFMVCGILCATYAITSIMSMIQLLGHRVTSPLTITYTNLYSLLLSTPVMPFVYAQAHQHHGSITIISLFALSNFIWQTLYLTTQYNLTPQAILVRLSLCNMFAWIVMGLCNYWFYEPLIRLFS